MENLKSPQKSPKALLKRYHLVLFIVIVAIILAGTILLLYGIVSKASGLDAVPQIGVSTSFDQATIDRINRLKTLDQPSNPLEFSQRRINPFDE